MSAAAISRSQVGVDGVRLGLTRRRDPWWVQPGAVFVGLAAFVVYVTWAGLQGRYYRFGPYLSPFYSPELWGSPEAWFGAAPPWWYPQWLRFSPAVFILWIPAGFRLTCYYNRGAYYKAFWADPPNCAVGEPRKSYWGENYFPLLLQNIHRYFMYLAVLLVLVLLDDVWHALWFTNAAGHLRFGIGVGTLVITLDVALVAAYTFGCHSLRHVCGGRLDCLAGRPVRAALYDCTSGLNRRHMAWFWVSLAWVGFSDLYVRLCAMGVWTDWRIL